MSQPHNNILMKRCIWISDLQAEFQREWFLSIGKQNGGNNVEILISHINNGHIERMHFSYQHSL